MTTSSLSPSANLISWRREATKEEIETRKQWEKEKEENQLEWERKTYDRLKAKFDPSS